MIKTPLPISQAELFFRCPGAARTIAALKQPPPSSMGMLAGRQMHEEVYLALTGKKKLDELEENARRVHENLSKLLHGPKWETLTKEAHVTIEMGGKPIWHGYMDLTAMGKKEALICDLKSSKTIPAKMNLQLRLYAVALFQRAKEIEKIRTAIVTPFYLDICDYDRDDYEWMKKEASSIAKAALRKNAKRSAGVIQCRMCPASGTEACPESLAEIAAFEALSKAKAELTPARLGSLLERAVLVEKMIKRLREEAARLLAESGQKEIETEHFRFRLAKGRRTRSVKDSVEAYRRLHPILGDITLSVFKLDLQSAADVFAKYHGISRAKGEALLAELLEGIIEEKEGKRYLKAEEKNE